MNLITTIKEKIFKKLGETSSHLFKTFFVYGFIAFSMILIKIMIARFYGQESLGIFTYFFSVASLAFLFTSFGFPEAITQIIIKEPGKLKSALLNSLKYLIPLTIFVLIVIFYLPIFKELRPYYTSFFLYLITYTLFYLTYSIFRGFKLFAEGSFYSLINRILFVGFIGVLFVNHFPFPYVLLSMSFALILATLISLPKIIFLYKKTTKKLSNINLVKVTDSIKQKKFLCLAISLFLMQVGFYSLRYIDAITIQYLVDFSSLGLYSAHSSITNAIRLVAYVFPVVVLPMAVISSYKLKKSLQKVLLVLVPFALLILAATYFFIPIFYGPEYKAIFLPIVLVISSTLLVIYAYFNSILVGENNFSRFFIIILSIDFILSLGLNTILNIFFILKWGIIGAPIATALTILLKITLNIYGIRKLRLSVGDDY